MLLEALPEEDLDVGDASTKQQQPQGPHHRETAADSTQSQEKTNSHDESTETIEGVIFGRSVRGHYASLNLVVMEGDAILSSHSKQQTNSNGNDPTSREDQYHVLVRIQFDTPDDAIVKDLRSYFRRYCKNGDLVRLQHGIYQDCLFHSSTTTTTTTTTTTSASTNNNDGSNHEDGWTEPRFVIHVQSIQQAQASLQVQKVRYWAQSQWQAWQNKYYRQGQQQQQQLQQQQKSRGSNSKNTAASTEEEGNNSQAHPAGGLEKRQQSEMVAKFLFRIMMTMVQQQQQQPPASEEDDRNHPNSVDDANNNSQSDALLRTQTLDYLNGGTGVLDVAGGSGLVSMALGLMGIQSTVVDPREAVGRLPGRDRKIYNRALKQQKQKEQKHEGKSTTTTDASEQKYSTADPPSASSSTICQPIMTTITPQVQVRPFQTMRAWFGTPPDGVDAAFRNPDNATVPLCDAQHDLLRDCRAIVALHPDEATDAIVDMAVHCRIPFVIVPCCVFCRLFPNRRMPSGEMVSSYVQLLDYLQAKHPSIQRTTLPFVGANTVLYSTF